MIFPYLIHKRISGKGEERGVFSLKNKVCIVTGGTGFFGRVIVDTLYKAQAKVIVIARNQAKLEQLAVAYNGDVEVYSADICDKNAIVKIASLVIGKYKKIDILVNNADSNPKVEGNMGEVSFEDFPIDAWKENIETGLTGTFICCQVFGKEMKSKGKGTILNISSEYGIIAPKQSIYINDACPTQNQIKPASYVVSKHGIIGLTKYLAAYWGSAGVRTNALCPAGMYNNQPEYFVENYRKENPLNRMSYPEEYASTILYMLSDSSSFLNGSIITVDGGRSIW